ncbi:ABC transporter substrate-binding protein [Nonomuraea sp. NPDC049714]|uniref:ABC transporter substrate-binding protein n=1 Tax=Nonomuraea sp. NPDC049714 TaxID=3364357 RepID=UPI00378C647C
MHWWRLAVALTLVPGVVIVTPWVWDRLFCRPGLPVSEVWGQGGECVGLSAGPYAFDRPELAGVMTKIAEQNEAAKEGSCARGTKPVTVGALVTLTSVEAGGRALHQLEGIAAAQAIANETGCVHPIRLRVAQMGASEQAATEVAELLAGEVSAVVGMGLSLQQTADAVDVLAKHKIPMVGDVITAEGFDRNGSKQDNPDFRRCDPSHTYQDGVGQGYFHRVAYRNAVQVDELAKYLESATLDSAGLKPAPGESGQKTLKATLKIVMTPISMDDPYTCTTLPLLHARFGPLRPVEFDPLDPTTVKDTAESICAGEGSVSVFYAARASHLPEFLKKLADESERGQCNKLTNLVVISTSDAARMRAVEVDPKLDKSRTAALGTPKFMNGAIRLIYTPLADPDVLPDGLGLKSLRTSFDDRIYKAADLNSGWAITGFDAMTTVADAVNALSALEPVTSSRIKAEIGRFVKGDRSVSGASGNITFDGNGNRDDSVPSVVRLCSVMGGEPKTVSVYPDEAPC